MGLETGFGEGTGPLSLGYEVDGQIAPLPEWARFYARLGSVFAEEAINEGRLILGLSAPTRYFAAAFLACGVLRSKYEPPLTYDPQKHFDLLSSQPAGTPLRFRQGSSIKRGELVKMPARQESEGIWIRDVSAKGNLRIFKQWDRLDDVELLAVDSDFKRPRQVVSNPALLKVIAPDIDPDQHASHSSQVCVIVGVQSSLRGELKEQELIISGVGRRKAAGVLDDALRCDAFRLNDNDPSHTTLVSAQADQSRVTLATKDSVPVIFDGVTGFLRLRSLFRSNPWIVVLDRASPSVELAADAFNQEYAVSANDAVLTVEDDTPSGVEVISFRTKSRQ